MTTRLVGKSHTRLVVIRGNSGSGKSSVARAIRAQVGSAVALVEQDYLRRTVLKEHDKPSAANIRLIDLVVRFALNEGRDVLLEGILWSGHYREMLDGLREDHVGSTWAYYLDVTFDESCTRHATRPQASEFTIDDMRNWYVTEDPLGWPSEHRVPSSSTLDLTVNGILRDTSLG